MLQRGVAALIAGDARGAAVALEGALGHHPFHPVVNFNLAVAYRLRGQLPLARGHARLAAELSGSAHAHVLYGLHLQLSGARERAQQHFEQALALEPSYRLAAMYLALAHREGGRRDDAIAGLERALVQGPGALPTLVAERVRGQLFDLRRAREPEAAVATALCSVAAVTEILLPDGTVTLLEPDAAEIATVSPSPARVCNAAEIAGHLHRASRVVVLTGAGASSASGLSTRKQLWQRYDRDSAVSAVGVAHDPTALWTVVRDFLGLDDHPPNAAHLALARLPRLAAVITQNVDNLHQRAAPEGQAVPVFELHGTLERMVCTACGAEAPHPARHYVREHLLPPPCPSCKAALRPDVVLFGESIAPRVFTESLRAVEACDLLLVVGCAMDVAPASELPRLAAARGAKVVEIKRSPSRISDAIGSELLLGPAEETLSEVYARLAELEALEPLPAAPPVRTAEPLATPFVLPAIGEEQELTLVRWLRKVGDTVTAGELIAELETDKACVEIEAPVGGVLRALRVGHAAVIKPGQPIADIEPVAPDGSRRALEVREASVPLFGDFGPHTASVRRAIEALDDARWLLPEGPREALEARVRALVDEHRKALGLEGPPIEVWFTDDIREPFARWKRDWQASATSVRPFDPITSAWQGALQAAHKRTASGAAYKSEPLRRLIKERLSWRIDHLFGGVHPWGYSHAELALHEPVLCRLSNLAAHGQDRDPPCPFAPIVALWKTGVWPFLLPDGVLGVYLPSPEGLAQSRYVAYGVPTGALHSFTGLSTLPLC